MDKLEVEKEINKIKRWNGILFAFWGSLLLLMLGAFVFYQSNHHFTSEKWMACPTNRIRLVDDLMNHYNLKGMSAAEVVAWLGEENQKGSQPFTSKLDKTCYPPDTTMIYFLGIDYMDGLWLIISFDNGIVSNYSIGVT